MSGRELRVNLKHTALLETAGEFAGFNSAELYYPGCGDDESPSYVYPFELSTIYVDRHDNEAIRLHREAGHEAYLADATQFQPEIRPDFVVFFNPTGIDVGRAVNASGLKRGGLVGYTSWDARRIPGFFQEDSGLAVRGIVKAGEVDERVEDYLPITSDEELSPERYSELAAELSRLGVSSHVIRLGGIIGTINQIKSRAEEEFASSGYLVHPLEGYDLELPTRKPLEYDMVLAEKVRD